jgi:hypothetical protein
MKSLNLLLLLCSALSAGFTINGSEKFNNHMNAQLAKSTSTSQQITMQQENLPDTKNLADFFIPTLASCKMLNALASSTDDIIKENIRPIIDAMTKTGSESDIESLMDQEIQGTLNFTKTVRACPALKQCLAHEETLLEEKLLHTKTETEIQEITKKFSNQKALCTQIMIDYMKAQEIQTANTCNDR